jgi:NhaP-type Na+/H+ or K+/H+ antiporter
VIRAGRFTVDATLTTEGGTTLGSTARLELTSTTYGVVTVAITGVAGGVLVVLVAFRLFRRVRAARAGPKDSNETGVPVDV